MAEEDIPSASLWEIKRIELLASKSLLAIALASSQMPIYPTVSLAVSKEYFQSEGKTKLSL